MLIPLISSSALPLWWATLLGYRYERPKVLSGQSNCETLQPPHPQINLYDCAVVSGTSGGAVIVETNGDPTLAVPVSPCLRQMLLQSKSGSDELTLHDFAKRVFSKAAKQVLTICRKIGHKLVQTDSIPKVRHARYSRDPRKPKSL